jgi:hypothetical protein
MATVLGSDSATGHVMARVKARVSEMARARATSMDPGLVKASSKFLGWGSGTLDGWY